MHWHVNNIYVKADGRTYVQLYVYDENDQPLMAADVPTSADPSQVEIEAIAIERMAYLETLHRQGKIGPSIGPIFTGSSLIGLEGGN